MNNKKTKQITHTSNGKAPSCIPVDLVELWSRKVKKLIFPQEQLQVLWFQHLLPKPQQCGQTNLYYKRQNTQLQRHALEAIFKIFYSILKVFSRLLQPHSMFTVCTFNYFPKQQTENLHNVGCLFQPETSQIWEKKLKKFIIQLFCSEIKGRNSPVTYFLDRMEFEMLTYSKYVFNLLL